MTTSNGEITSYELEVLEMFGGLRDWEYGAWVNACCEFLGDFGLITTSCPYQITEGGKDYLCEHSLRLR